MNNKDLFREWYISQINPQTEKPYVETSVPSYIAAIQRLVAAGLVGPDIFDVDLEGFTLQISRAQKEQPAEFATQEYHGNLKNGIKWWKRFLETSAEGFRPSHFRKGSER